MGQAGAYRAGTRGHMIGKAARWGVLALAACAAVTQGRESAVVSPPSSIARALAIVAPIYGADYSGLKVAFFAPNCPAYGGGMMPPVDGPAQPGVLTGAKGNCVRGSLAPYSWQLNLAWGPGSTLHDALPQAAYEAFEYQKYGLPDVYWKSDRWTSGEAPRLIREASAALKAAGL